MPRINHLIVLMLENRSFDHLFGFFPSPAGDPALNQLARGFCLCDHWHCEVPRTHQAQPHVHACGDVGRLRTQRL
jgi:phospholipase C